MAKQFERNSSGKSEKNKAEKNTKNRKEKGEKKPLFERFRDDSKPSDFGKTRSKPAYKKDWEDKKENTKPKFSPERTPKREDKKEQSTDKKERFGDKNNRNEKKSFSDKPKFIKEKKTANPFDLDESDFEYGTEKPAFKKQTAKGYNRKPLRKSRPSGSSSKSSPHTKSEDGTIRLNKYLSNAGICSRREADELIASGAVKVNGKIVTEMGFKIKPTDIVNYGGQTLKKERLVYLILNKPKDYISTVTDPMERRTVLELVQDACRERIYPVGRLDRATTGLLMFTNDGELTKKLTHPRYGVRKIYHVELDKPLKREDMDSIAEGIELEDGPIKADEITYVGDGKDKSQIGIELHSGKNRIVRRIFEQLGYNVRKLDRVMFGPLTKKDLPKGRWRFLTEAEIGMLKMISSK